MEDEEESREREGEKRKYIEKGLKRIKRRNKKRKK